MFPITLIYEIAAIRLRQRRILKILNDKGISRWDGLVEMGDPDLEKLAKEITDRWAREQIELSKELGNADFPA